MKTDKLMNPAAGIFNVIGALAILIIMVVTVADVIMSKIFGLPFPGATEVIIAVMPISVFAYLFIVQRKGRHIAIEVITGRFSEKWKIVLKFLAQGIGIYLFGLLTYLNVPMAIYSVRIGEHTGGTIAVPLYPAKVVIPLATGLITIQISIELCKGVADLFSHYRSKAGLSGRQGNRT